MNYKLTKEEKVKVTECIDNLQFEHVEVSEDNIILLLFLNEQNANVMIKRNLFGDLILKVEDKTIFKLTDYQSECIEEFIKEEAEMMGLDEEPEYMWCFQNKY